MDSINSLSAPPAVEALTVVVNVSNPPSVDGLVNELISLPTVPLQTR